MIKLGEPAGPVPRPGTRRIGLRLHLAALVLVLLVPAVAGGISTAWQLGSASRRHVETALRGSARAVAMAVDRELEVIATSAEGLASWPALRRGDTVTDREMADFLAQASVVSDGYRGWVQVVEPDGTPLLSTQEVAGSARSLARGRLWIDQVIATGRPVVSDIFLEGHTQRAMLAVFVPVFQDGRRPGQGRADAGRVLILAFDSVHLAHLLAGLRPGEVTALVHSTEGRFIARSVGQAVAANRPVQGWSATAIGLARDGLAEGVTSDGRKVVAAFQRLDRLPWAAIVSIPFDAYDNAWRTPVERLALGGALLLAAGLGLAALLARRLLRPITALVGEAEAVALGQLQPHFSSPAPVAEFEALRLGLRRSAEAIHSRAVAEGRLQAAETAAQALRAERDRARLYFEVAGVMLLVLDPQGRVQGINRRGLEVLGLAHEGLVVGRDWVSEFLPLNVRPEVRLMFERIGTGTFDASVLAHEHPVLRADGEQRLIAWHNAALHDAEGRLAVIVASGEDITDPRAAEERQVLLMREVDHRAKNALAVVQSILRMTETPDPADFAATVEGRVGALARAHTLLANESWNGSDLRLLVEAELSNYVAAGRAEVSGPSVWLSPEAVQAVSMVAHELATNAMRHGALSQPEGRVSIVWEATPGGELRVSWTEQFGPGRGLARPGRRGFGLRLVDATVRSQFRGRISYDWRPEGLHCVMTIAAERVSLRGPLALPPGAQPAQPPAPATPAGSAPRPRLRRGDARILLAEDEPLVALELQGRLTRMGFTVVGPAANLQQALQLAASEKLAGAVLDVNLNGLAVFPVADLLVRRGVPVVFATGYGSLPGGWATSGGQGRTALLRKPLSQGALTAALQELVGLPEPAPAEMQEQA